MALPGRARPSSPASCTPSATPPSMTPPRSQRSRAASCGGAASSVGTSGRRQSEPAPLAPAVLNAIASVSAEPEPSRASDHFRLSTPACLPSGTRPATAMWTRRISARARSRRSGGAALRAGTNGGQPCITEQPAEAIALCVGSSAVPGLRARSRQRGHSRSSIPTSPPSCTRSGTPGSTPPGSARGPASSSGGSAPAAGTIGRPPSRRAPTAPAARRATGRSAAVHERRRGSEHSLGKPDEAHRHDRLRVRDPEPAGRELAAVAPRRSAAGADPQLVLPPQRSWPYEAESDSERPWRLRGRRSTTQPAASSPPSVVRDAHDSRELRSRLPQSIIGVMSISTWLGKRGAASRRSSVSSRRLCGAHNSAIARWSRPFSQRGYRNRGEPATG